MSDNEYGSDTLNDMTPEPVDQRRIVVLISGSGSNLAALIEAQSHDRLGGDIVAVISNEPAAFGLKRAHEAGIELPESANEITTNHESIPGWAKAYRPRLLERFHK